MTRGMLLIYCLLLVCTSAISATDRTGGERVFVDLPKSIYIAGESVLFKLGLEWDGNISPSKIAYAELIDRNGQSMAQEMIRMNSDLQDGYLDIPANIASDHYLLRVYSRMGLSDPESIFHQFITVINPQRPPNPAANQDKAPTSNQPARTAGILEKTVYGPREKVMFNLPQGNISEVKIAVSPRNPFLLGEYSRKLDRKVYKEQKIDVKVPELYGHVIRAKSTRKAMDTTETFFLSAHGTQSMLFTAKPNTQGELYFDMGPHDDVKFLIVQSAEWKEPLNVLVESPFPIFQFNEDFNFPALHIDASYHNYLVDLLAAKEVASYFYLPIINEGKELVTGIYPDEVFLLDDYNRFDNFSTVIREYVPKVRVRRQNRETVFRVFNDPANAVFDKNPLIILDGMPIFDSELLGDFNPENIQSLGLVYRDYFLNKDVFPGVIALSSYENDLGGFPVAENALYIPYTGPQRPRSYRSLLDQLDQKSAFNPDFRTILLWDSNYNNLDSVEYFYTSEVTGPFQIRIRYIDEKGVEQEIVDYFEVKE